MEEENVLSMNEPLVIGNNKNKASSSALTGATAKEYTWPELVHLETRRREILQRSELPYLRILTFVEGTCLGALYNDPLLWITVGIFVTIRSQVWWFGALPAFAREIGSLNIDIIGGFLSFFLVFFVNQSQSRFQEMFKESMNCIKRIYDVSSTVATAFPKPQALRILRYMNAAHAIGYAGLSPTHYSRGHFFGTVNNMYSLLTDQELETINEMHTAPAIGGPDAFHELVEWCMMDVDLAYKNKLIEVKDFAALREKIMAFRGSMNTLYEYSDQPILFFYIHFLCLLSALYLPLFAVSNAYKAGSGDERHWSADVLSGLIVLVQAFFVIGLRMLGRKMVEPFGDDLEDLSVLRYVKTAWQRSNRILATRFPSDVSSELEERMVQKRKEKIGEPWQSSLMVSSSSRS